MVVGGLQGAGRDQSSSITVLCTTSGSITVSDTAVQLPRALAVSGNSSRDSR